MPIYFFDSRDNETFIEDDEGLEYGELEVVKVSAAKALAELARDVIPSCHKRELAIEVRDVHGPVLIAKMTFEALILRPA